MTTTEAWCGHPLVKKAIGKAGGPGDAMAVIEALKATLDDLEDRFPGLPFSEILEPSRRSSRTKVRAGLVALGYTDDEAREMVGVKGSDPQRAPRRLDRDSLFGMVSAGAPLDSFTPADQTYVKVLRRQPTPKDVEAGRLIALGASCADVMRRLGCARQTFYNALLRSQYAAWVKA